MLNGSNVFLLCLAVSLLCVCCVFAVCLLCVCCVFSVSLLCLCCVFAVCCICVFVRARVRVQGFFHMAVWLFISDW